MVCLTIYTPQAVKLVGEVKKSMNKKTIALATTALLLLSAVAVLADGADKTKDWWQEMKDHHTTIHGDDFETHHQSMHGEDWQDHVAGCHSADEENTMMGSGMGSMRGTGATMM